MFDTKGGQRPPVRSTALKGYAALMLLGVVLILALEGMMEQVTSGFNSSLLRVGKSAMTDQFIAPIANFGHFDARVRPMWNCSGSAPEPMHDEDGPSKKLVFVHVFKTAGSTFRQFFQSYGEQCQKSVAVVIHCSGLSAESRSDQNTIWSERAGKSSSSESPCVLKWASNSSGVVHSQGSNVTNSLLQQNNIDILIGHLPIGVDEHWLDDTVQPPASVDTQYVTFFREPVAKYVSGRLFVNQKKHWTFDEAVRNIKRQVMEEHETKGYYEKYSSYLLTPEQKDLQLSPSERTRQVMANLVQLRVLVGVVERMGPSLELLQQVIDGTRDLTEFVSTLDPNASHKNETVLHANKSELSTSKIVAELEKDEDFMVVMKDFLRYEFDLYEFALELHERQYQWLTNSVSLA